MELDVGARCGSWMEELDVGAECGSWRWESWKLEGKLESKVELELEGEQGKVL